MNRKTLIEYIINEYGKTPDYPWEKWPHYAVFRHDNHKWFAIIMDVPKNKLNALGNEKIDIINLKCDPLIIGTIRNFKGIFPAYHMNKDFWISVALEEAEDDNIKFLLNLSYTLTKK